MINKRNTPVDDVLIDEIGAISVRTLLINQEIFMNLLFPECGIVIYLDLKQILMY